MDNENQFNENQFNELHALINDQADDYNRLEDLFDHELPSPEAIHDEAENAITIDDSDLCEMERQHQARGNKIQNLEHEYRTVHQQCNQLKQEIQTIRGNLFLHNDCRQNLDLIYTNIETETCVRIENHATDIRNNIRNSRNTAEMNLRHLQANAKLLALQFEYIKQIEYLSTIYNTWFTENKKFKEAEAHVQTFSQIREERKRNAEAQARLERETNERLNALRMIYS